MSRGLSSTLKTELAKANFSHGFLAKLEFNSTYYFTTAQHDLTYDSNSYLSSGMLLDLSTIGEESGLSTGGITLTLTAAATSLQTDLLANGHLHRQITIWLVLLNANLVIIDAPFELYRGRVESMSIKDTKRTSTLELGVSNHWSDFDRSEGRSMTDDSQRQKFVGDKGFEFAPQAGLPLMWGRNFYWVEVEVTIKRKWGGTLLGWIYEGMELVHHIKTRFDKLNSAATVVNIHKLPLVYGSKKVPGQLIFQEVQNPYLYQCFALCEGPVNSISFAADPAHTAAQLSYIDSYSSLGSTSTESFPAWMTDIQALDDTVDPILSAGEGAPSWTSAHQLKGVAFVYFRTQFMYDDTFGFLFDGFPAYDFTVGGIALTGNDTNPALILKDYLTSTKHGASIAAGDIDTASFTTAEGICNQTNSGVKRHECSIIMDTKIPIVDNIKAILQTCNGRLHWVDGQYRMQINDTFSGSPVVSFDAENMLANIEVVGESKRDRATQVVAKYIDQAALTGAEVSWPDVNNESSIYAAHLAADNAVALKKEINLKGVTGTNGWKQARFLAKQRCLRSRDSFRCKFTALAEALEVIPGDIVTITHDTPGWTAKEFRVESVEIEQDLSIGIEAVEHQDSHYAWDTDTDVPADSPDTNRPAPTVVSAASGLSVTESLYSTREGAGVKTKAVVAWTASTEGGVDQYEVGYKLSAASTYVSTRVSVDTFSTDILDLTPGAYDFRVAAINEIGSKSSYISASYTIGGLPSAPATPTTFRVNSMGTMALAQWDLSADLDVRQGGFYQVAHSPDSSGAVLWNQATTLTEEIAGHSSSVIVPLLAGTYLVRAKDSSGQVSAPAEFVSSGATMLSLSIVATITEEPSFAGTHTQTVGIDNKLKIDSNAQMDSIADIDAVTDWDTFGAIITGDGPQYDFANMINLGSVQSVRLRSYVKSYTDDFTNLFDLRTTNIDEWSDFDLYESVNNDDTSFRLQMRKTDDDPGASPTWGDWSDFYVAEESGRGFDFRCFLTTTNSSNNLVIENLRVYAEQLAS